VNASLRRAGKETTGGDSLANSKTMLAVVLAAATLVLFVVVISMVVHCALG
jgi:hypothetical protein